jgi:hypothetical protein
MQLGRVLKSQDSCYGPANRNMKGDDSLEPVIRGEFPMLEIDLKHLPSSEERPSSDDVPVDNEDQNLLPNVLLFLLNSIWATRKVIYLGLWIN